MQCAATSGTHALVGFLALQQLPHSSAGVLYAAAMLRLRWWIYILSRLHASIMPVLSNTPGLAPSQTLGLKPWRKLMTLNDADIASGAPDNFTNAAATL